MSFALSGTGLPRVVQGQIVLLDAALDLAEWEVQIATKMVDPRQLDDQVLGGRDRLGSVQGLKRVLNLIADPHHGGQTDPGSAALNVISANFERSFKGLASLGDRAKIMQKLASKVGQRVYIGPLDRESMTAFNQVQRALIMVRRGLQPRCR